MPEFFIHCGLHKTGTTALQHFLASNARALLESGLHYPASGTSVGGAHHNLAWELSRDRRFVRKNGGLELMLRQTAAIGRDTVVSSEDFESSLLSPERWTSLLETLKPLGYNVTFIVYLREPASYLQSLFLENIKHGCGDEFGAVARQVVERGSYSFKDWTFQFDYDAIARQMARISGARVVFRSFERLLDGSIVPDFFSLIGHTLPKGIIAADIEANLRTDTVTLLRRFVLNRYAHHFPDPELIAGILDLMAGGREVVPVMPRRLAEVIARQRPSEVKQAIDQQSTVAPTTRRPRSGGWEVNISRLFSWETQVEALAIYEQAPGSGTDKIAALKVGDQGRLETWRDWVAGGL